MGETRLIAAVALVAVAVVFAALPVDALRAVYKTETIDVGLGAHQVTLEARDVVGSVEFTVLSMSKKALLFADAGLTQPLSPPAVVSGGIVYVGDYLDIGKDTFSFAIEDDNDFVVAPVVLEIYETRTVDDQSLVTNLGWTHVALTSHGVASGDLNYVVTETPPGGGLRDGLDEADPEVVAGEVLSSDQLFYELDPGVDSTSFKWKVEDEYAESAEATVTLDRVLGSVAVPEWIKVPKSGTSEAVTFTVSTPNGPETPTEFVITELPAGAHIFDSNGVKVTAGALPYTLPSAAVAVSAVDGAPTGNSVGVWFARMSDGTKTNLSLLTVSVYQLASQPAYSRWGVAVNSI